MYFTPMTPIEELPPQTSYRLLKVSLFISFLCVVTILGAWRFFVYTIHTTPVDLYTTPLEFTIPEGASARAVASLLTTMHISSSESLFYLMTLMYFNPSSIKAGTYRLIEPVSMFNVAEKIIAGDVVHDLVTLTHIEGERASNLAAKAASLLPNFSEAEFLRLAEGSEGKLYPDTYYVDEEYTAKDVYTLLIDTYETKTAPLREQIASHSLTEQEILTLASIIEREANTEESMRMVSGILQNRLEIGMALQADASIEYVLDKELSELTPEDLKRDTPYNTYLYPGLPPTPIGNPGLVAIEAVLNPTPSPYFYYITGTDGEFYYAKTFDEHRRNIARHLR